MPAPERTKAAVALTDLFLDLFRLNNRIIAAGDRLVADLGLTSARWQVLGTIVAADRPQPVAWVARDMGANRQNVQRIANDLAEDGLVAFKPNPHHRRAQLVVLTDTGKQAFDAAMRLQAPWVNWLSEGIEVRELETTHSVVKALRRKLEGEAEEQA
ncbi:MarR family winged helix-turn-helix transcriptional regulator [Mesorhizobium sp.]|uniref:MarR family winged helix-turn-helix transcriptional regulator n=1 Tax=Mesorhizobium sp. TaxID=1871066 RepID=UPI000FE3CB7A|nr:MarR family winged helix-turn-helix transcriptional regulator [Mesorhizobium sp.]RWG81611.1 MAG: MarR family transcriptional regulator [Mesorhizobium sp.]RWK04976.1 MAG: MarR family transcriptional regulator [Mesorhizobium sp.]RWK15595.1 MAG: MarR family transcriptional regulator [Mesorhizobium sp.]